MATKRYPTSSSIQRSGNPLKILYDARFITQGQTGVGRCTEMLLRELMSQNRPSLDLHMLYTDPIHSALVSDRSIHTRIRFDSHPRGDFYRNWTLRRLLKVQQFSVFHSPAFYSIQWRPSIPQIVTIHDMAVYDYPETFPWTFVKYFRWLIGSSCKNADLIICSTEFTAKRMLFRFPDIDHKIRIIPFAVSDPFFKADLTNSDFYKKRLALPDKFILTVATMEPRKNLLTLLNAYSIYCRRCDRPLPLIITGKSAKGSDQIRQRANEPDIAANIRLLDYVSDEELVSLYRMASLTIYPSRYEGFGLPVLEAMASGCPVITSNTTSIPEIAGDAALFVNPESPAEIADTMTAVCQNRELQKTLINKGRKRAEMYRWTTTADKTIDVYFEAATIRKRK